MSGCDQEIFPSIVIEIVPSQPGTESTKSVWQERLLGPIIEGAFNMEMIDPCANVLKEGCNGEN